VTWRVWFAVIVVLLAVDIALTVTTPPG